MQSTVYELNKKIHTFSDFPNAKHYDFIREDFLGFNRTVCPYGNQLLKNGEFDGLTV